ncbi:MAG: GatB/YqeY domain-containing protein [Alphaproteobacteria bacterium]|nr:GatB/YqeY domain-containing protein [Alphaproteobacteria bacterium]
MDKRSEFNIALKESLKNKEPVAVSTIRLILAALKDRDITARGKGQADGVEESEILAMLQTMVKQRQESSQTYSDAGRDDLAEREEAEIEVIRRFMPRQLTEEEVGALVETLIGETGAAGIKDMGKVMGVLKERYAGQVDMGKAGAAVKAKLG